MSALLPLKRFAADFVRALWSEARRFVHFFRPEFGIELVEHDERHLVLASLRRRIVVDKRYHTVKSKDKVLARFDEIQSIEIAAHGSEDEGTQTWVVSLYLSWRSRVFVGLTDDQSDASIAAAHLSTITGKKVVAI